MRGAETVLGIIRRGLRQPESRVPRKSHARFGGGRMEKGCGRLPVIANDSFVTVYGP
jgi:hypothetical protein